MGKVIFEKGVSFQGLDTNFLNNNVIPFIKSLPFDTIITSGYRSLEEQRKLREEYEKGLRTAIANKPGYSAHNWGLAIDIHPISGSQTDYDTMLLYSKNFGLKRDSKERWHFQSDKFNFQLAEKWLKEKLSKPNNIFIFSLFIILSIITYKYYKG